MWVFSRTGQEHPVSELAASAASPKIKSREAPWERRTAARLADDGARGALLEFGPLDLVFGEAALAVDLITARKSSFL